MFSLAHCELHVWLPFLIVVRAFCTFCYSLATPAMHFQLRGVLDAAKACAFVFLELDAVVTWKRNHANAANP